MKNTVQYFTRQLFDRDSTEDIELHEVTRLLSKYPYFTPARLLEDQLKLKEQETDGRSGVLYFNNHLWYEFLLNLQRQELGTEPEFNPIKADAVEQAAPLMTAPEPAVVDVDAPAAPAPIEAAVEVPQENAPIAFEPYHTIDYFASQGIKLAPNDLSKDKFGQQLKSFTEWLRSMKRLPAAETTTTDEPNQQTVAIAAEHSIEEREVLTEAMAEVWLKQGNTQKAIEVYEKLSLMNSGKSSYFAAKIDELKSI